MGTPAEVPQEAYEENSDVLPEDGVYTEPDELALYIHTFGRLPDNFMTKQEARDTGWEGGSLESVCPGMCIRR